MKVTYEFFKEHPRTKLLIGKLMAANFPEIKSSYKVKKLIDALGKEFEIYVSLLKEVEAKVKWEDKKVVNNDEVKPEFDKLFAHEFEVDFEPLTLEELKVLSNVTPMEIELLKMISDPTAFDSLLE